ncbi:MAG TPA: hypothetical protein VFI47_26710, partial [Acidimicrobiales bacterium]|nr:hypothetical protein [Acidimicrobiales bacterium]
MSEVLGLAWEDVDLDAGTARVHRASVYVDGRGQQRGPPKTAGAHGEHWLMPTTVALLRKRRETQDDERAIAPVWEARTYGGEPVSLVFTTPTGGLVLRQTIAKVVKQAARTAGIAAGLGTHAGQRTVVTTLFVDGDEALEDIAHFVGDGLRQLGCRSYARMRAVSDRASARRPMRSGTCVARPPAGAPPPRTYRDAVLCLNAAGGGGDLGNSRRRSPDQVSKKTSPQSLQRCPRAAPTSMNALSNKRDARLTGRHRLSSPPFHQSEVEAPPAATTNPPSAGSPQRTHGNVSGASLNRRRPPLPPSSSVDGHTKPRHGRDDLGQWPLVRLYRVCPRRRRSHRDVLPGHGA